MSILCRLCAELRESDEIKTTINDANWNIEAKLIICCQWNSLQADDMLPKEVCNFCFDILEQSWTFSQNVTVAQMKLQEIYGVKPIVTNFDFETTERPTHKQFSCKLCGKRFPSHYKKKKHICAADIPNTAKIKKEPHKKEFRNRTKDESSYNEGDHHPSDEDSDSDDDKTGAFVSAEVKLEGDGEEMDVKTAAAFECNQCESKFETEIECESHIKTADHSNVGPYFCYLCCNGFTRLPQLRYHMRSHTKPKPISCKFCHKPFQFGRSYFRHLKAKHYLDKTKAKEIMKGLGGLARIGRFVCENCGKVFTENNRLRYHMVTHFDDRPHKCEVCNKGFKLKTHLKTHYRVHTGERKFQCNQCGKQYSAKTILNKHMEDHTGNISRPFPCDFCPKTFRTQFNLTNHRRTHTGEKPYSCPPCNYAVCTETQLKNHLKTKRHLANLKIKESTTINC